MQILILHINPIVCVQSRIVLKTKELTIANSYRTTVPAGIITQYNLKEGDKLEWTLKAENGDIVVVVKPIKK